jgi:hypothetical protein
MAKASRDYLLMFLASPADRYEADQVRVMKGMFLFTKQGPDSVRSLYNFKPYDWGPFDSAVYRDLEKMEAEGLVVATLAGGNRRVYRVTEKGKMLAEALGQGEEPAVTDALRQAKHFTTSMGFVPLLKAIYEKYPDQATRTRLR